MTAKAPELISTGGAGAGQGGNVHRFAHKAMAAVFEILIAGQEAEYARQAAQAAFEELDRLHDELNRFSPTSDVSQINALGAGQAVRVGLATFECLKAAVQVSADTHGAFDVTVGPLVDLWKPRDRSKPNPSEDELATARAATGMEHLVLDEVQHAVGVQRDGMRVDLGGIGKGYAVDQMAAMLGEWSVTTVLVHGGQSTAVGLGAPPGAAGWKVSVGNPKAGGEPLASVCLNGRALSGSGAPPSDRHIVDPRSGRPATANLGAWAVTTSATEADALSTAFLVMTPEDVRQYCKHQSGVSAVVFAADEAVHRFGTWET